MGTLNNGATSSIQAAVSGEVTITHTLPTPGLSVIQSDQYQDGSMLFRLGKGNQQGCNEPNLYISVLRYDGVFLDVDTSKLSIPARNYCGSSAFYLNIDDADFTSYHCKADNDDDFQVEHNRPKKKCGNNHNKHTRTIRPTTTRSCDKDDPNCTEPTKTTSSKGTIPTCEPGSPGCPTTTCENGDTRCTTAPSKTCSQDDHKCNTPTPVAPKPTTTCGPNDTGCTQAPAPAPTTTCGPNDTGCTQAPAPAPTTTCGPNDTGSPAPAPAPTTTCGPNDTGSPTPAPTPTVITTCSGTPAACETITTTIQPAPTTTCGPNDTGCTQAPTLAPAPTPTVITTCSGTPAAFVEDSIGVYATKDQYILVTYYCDATTEQRCVTAINWDGQITNPELKFDYSNTCKYETIVKGYDSDTDGFLRACYVTDTSTQKLFWETYTAIDFEGTFTTLKSGTINTFTFTSTNYTNATYIFPTEDGGYSVVTASGEIDKTSWSVSTYFLPKDDDAIGPFVLYTESTLVINSFNIERCNIAYQSFGYSCIISILTIENTVEKNVFVNIDFYSTGAANNVTQFELTQLNGWEVLTVETLYHGGWIITAKNANNDINGLVISNYGTYFSDWGLSSQTIKYSTDYGTLRNNTVWVILYPLVQSSDSTTWTLMSTSTLTSFTTVQGGTDGPGGYGSSNIVSTQPEKGGRFEYGAEYISISYNVPVLLAEKNITIYERSTNSSSQGVMRQTSSGLSPFVSISDNESKVVQVQVMKTSLNKPDTTYFVTVDNGFVKENSKQQSLIGITGKQWNITTGSDGYDVSGGTWDKAIVRLTILGTEKYLSFNQTDKTVFIDGMKTGISTAVGCEESIVDVSLHYQYDWKHTLVDQILLSVDFSATSTGTSPATLVSYLNDTIVNKDYNTLSKGASTMYLDSTHGAYPATRLWDTYKWILIGFFIGLAILLVLLFWAHLKNKSGRNFTSIVLFPIILIDFGMDVGFVANHGKDLKWLWPTSLVFLIVPIVLNCIFTFFTFSNELSIKKAEQRGESFSKWWQKYSLIAWIFGILSCIDTVALSVLSSRTAGIKSLSAPFSHKGKTEILFMTALITFIEDLPQLIIYSLYIYWTVVPAILPILVLSSYEKHDDERGKDSDSSDDDDIPRGPNEKLTDMPPPKESKVVKKPDDSDSNSSSGSDVSSGDTNKSTPTKPLTEYGNEPPKKENKLRTIGSSPTDDKDDLTKSANTYENVGNEPKTITRDVNDDDATNRTSATSELDIAAIDYTQPIDDDDESGDNSHIYGGYSSGYGYGGTYISSGYPIITSDTTTTNKTPDDTTTTNKTPDDTTTTNKTPDDTTTTNKTPDDTTTTNKTPDDTTTTNKTPDDTITSTPESTSPESSSPPIPTPSSSSTTTKSYSPSSPVISKVTTEESSKLPTSPSSSNKTIPFSAPTSTTKSTTSKSKKVIQPQGHTKTTIKKTNNDDNNKLAKGGDDTSSVTNVTRTVVTGDDDSITTSGGSRITRTVIVEGDDDDDNTSSVTKVTRTVVTGDDDDTTTSGGSRITRTVIVEGDSDNDDVTTSGTRTSKTIRRVVAEDDDDDITSGGSRITRTVIVEGDSDNDDVTTSGSRTSKTIRKVIVEGDDDDTTSVIVEGDDDDNIDYDDFTTSGGSRTSKTVRKVIVEGDDDDNIDYDDFTTSGGSRTSKTTRKVIVEGDDDDNIDISGGSRTSRTIRKVIVEGDDDGNIDYDETSGGSRTSRTIRKVIVEGDDDGNIDYDETSGGSRTSKTTRTVIVEGDDDGNIDYDETSGGSRTSKTTRTVIVEGDDDGNIDYDETSGGSRTSKTIRTVILEGDDDGNIDYDNITTGGGSRTTRTVVVEGDDDNTTSGGSRTTRTIVVEGDDDGNTNSGGSRTSKTVKTVIVGDDDDDITNSGGSRTSKTIRTFTSGSEGGPTIDQSDEEEFFESSTTTTTTDSDGTKTTKTTKSYK
nr:5203_t:CDS:10 [Entrophospora candida]